MFCEQPILNSSYSGPRYRHPRGDHGKPLDLPDTWRQTPNPADWGVAPKRAASKGLLDQSRRANDQAYPEPLRLALNMAAVGSQSS